MAQKTAAKPAKPAAVKPSTNADGHAAAKTSKPKVSEHQIRMLAYQKWEAAGKPLGDGLMFWLQAEREAAQSEINSADASVAR